MYEDIVEIFQDLLSDDEEIVEVVERPRRPKVYRNRIDHFNQWDNKEFLNRFRITKESVTQVLGHIEGLIAHPTNRYGLILAIYVFIEFVNFFCRNQCVDPLTQLLLTLRFYSSGSMIITMGDFTGVHKSTASRIISKVTRTLASLAPQYIKMPSTEEEIAEAKTKFYEIARFPKTIGVIDCTHIRIQSPGNYCLSFF